MRTTPKLLLLLLCGCGAIDEVSQNSPRNLRPCQINLGYNRTMVSGRFDFPTYEAKEYSDSCKAYLGEPIQSLRFSLKVRALESVGIIEQVSIDGRRIPLTACTLTTMDIMVNDIDTSEVDNGPLQMESIWASFAFPQDSEKSLYPSKVELIITPRT